MATNQIGILVKSYASLGTITIGIFLLWLGFSEDQDNSVLIGLGASMVGSGVGVLAARLDVNTLLHEIHLSVSRSMTSQLFSEEREASVFRKKWHVYHLTEKDAKWVWRYHQIDFAKTPVPGVLSAPMDAVDDGRVLHYTVEAVTRNTRLVAFIHPQEGNERDAVVVFPRAGNFLNQTIGGIAFIQTLDQDHGVFPALISSTPIVQNLTRGTVKDQKAQETLSSEWARIFAGSTGDPSSYALLPVRADDHRDLRNALLELLGSAGNTT